MVCGIFLCSIIFLLLLSLYLFLFFKRLTSSKLIEVNIMTIPEIKPLELSHIRDSENDLVWFPLALYQCDVVNLVKKTDRRGVVSYITTWSLDVYPNYILHDAVQETTSRMIKHLNKMDLFAATIYGGCDINPDKEVVLAGVEHTKEAVLLALSKRALIDPAVVTFESLSDTKCKLVADPTSMFVTGEVVINTGSNNVIVVDPWYFLANATWNGTDSVTYGDTGFMLKNTPFKHYMLNMKPANGTVMEFELPAVVTDICVFFYGITGMKGSFSTEFSPAVRVLSQGPMKAIDLGLDSSIGLQDNQAYRFICTFTTTSIQITHINLTTNERVDLPVQTLPFNGLEGDVAMLCAALTSPTPMTLTPVTFSGAAPIRLPNTDIVNVGGWDRLHSCSYDSNAKQLNHAAPFTLFDYGVWKGYAATRKVNVGETYKLTLPPENVNVWTGWLYSGFAGYMNTRLQSSMFVDITNQGSLSVQSALGVEIEGNPPMATAGMVMELTALSNRHLSIRSTGDGQAVGEMLVMFPYPGITLDNAYLNLYSYGVDPADTTLHPSLPFEVTPAIKPQIPLIDSSAIVWGNSQQMTAGVGTLTTVDNGTSNPEAFIAGSFKIGQSFTFDYIPAITNKLLHIAIQPTNGDIAIGDNKDILGIKTATNTKQYRLFNPSGYFEVPSLTEAQWAEPLALRITYMNVSHIEFVLFNKETNAIYHRTYARNPKDQGGVNRWLELTGDDFIVIKVISWDTGVGVGGMVINYW